jgi:hypothetical protein
MSLNAIGGGAPPAPLLLGQTPVRRARRRAADLWRVLRSRVLRPEQRAATRGKQMERARREALEQAAALSIHTDVPPGADLSGVPIRAQGDLSFYTAVSGRRRCARVTWCPWMQLEHSLPLSARSDVQQLLRLLALRATAHVWTRGLTLIL